MSALNVSHSTQYFLIYFRIQHPANSNVRDVIPAKQSRRPEGENRRRATVFSCANGGKIQSIWRESYLAVSFRITEDKKIKGFGGETKPYSHVFIILPRAPNVLT